MAVDSALDQLPREELVRRARELGAQRPEVMTRVELRDEIVRLSESDPLQRKKSRGWLGVARDLVASVMDAGLNLPHAAAAIRGDARPAEETTGPPPVATLTLAEIYLAQGHVDRALGVLAEVLVAEPEHPAALALRERIFKEGSAAARRRVPVVTDVEPEPIEEPGTSVPAPAPFVSVPAPEAMRVPPIVHDHDAAPTSFREPMSESEPTPAPYAVPVPEAAPEIVPAPLVVSEPPPVMSEPPPAPSFSSGPTFSDPAPRDAHAAGTPPPSSSPIPTMAAPSARDLTGAEAPPSGPACALAQAGAAVEAHYRLPAGAGHFVLRVAWFVPGATGANEGSLDVPLDPALTRVALPGLEQTAHVRAALGTKDDGAFHPLAVAWVYRVTAGGVKVEFAAPGPEPLSLRSLVARA